jgi:hypothetical protein
MHGVERFRTNNAHSALMYHVVRIYADTVMFFASNELRVYA